MNYHIVRFKEQENSHIIVRGGIDKNSTKCSSKHRKDYEIMSLAGSFTTEEAKGHVTCPKCKEAI